MVFRAGVIPLYWRPNHILTAHWHGTSVWPTHIYSFCLLRVSRNIKLPYNIFGKTILALFFVCFCFQESRINSQESRVNSQEFKTYISLQKPRIFVCCRWLWLPACLTLVLWEESHALIYFIMKNMFIYFILHFS